MKRRRRPTCNEASLEESRKRKREAEEAEIDRMYNVAQNRLEEYTRQRLQQERERETEARREAEKASEVAA